MKKGVDKKTLEKEAFFWGTMKTALKRDEIRVCRK